MSPCPNPDGLRESILVGAHWRTAIRPSEFKADLLPTLAECWRVAEAANVQFRGWDYPHVDHECRTPGQDYIQSWVEFMGERSFWRLYQSGQFGHVFAFREDSYGDDLLNRVRRVARMPPGFVPTGYADFINVLYTLTEIFSFASRLAERGKFGPRLEIDVSMHNVANRLLVSFEPGRFFHYFLPATERDLTFGWAGDATEFLASADALARRATNHFYERFGWTDAPETLLVDEQATFLSRRRGTQQ